MAPLPVAEAPRRRRPMLFSSLLAVGALSLVGRYSVAFTRTEETELKAQQLLREADAVCFDVDSTVVKTEGIDLLAKCYDVEEEVANLTRAAMEGGMKFEVAMKARLELMRPTRDSLEKCVETEGKPKWTPGVRKVIKRLHERGTHVFLVSGGFRNMIEPLADKLDVPYERIYANTILFDEDGNYAGFDETEPTSHDGGKPEALKRLKKQGYKTMIMVGDGATDLQARPPAKAFIGFGGVQVREKVQKGADWFVMSFKEVLDVLPAP